MIHTLLSEVVKGTLAHTPRKTACDGLVVAGIESHLLHHVAQPVAFSHDNADVQRSCFELQDVLNTKCRPWLAVLVSSVLTYICTVLYDCAYKTHVNA